MLLLLFAVRSGTSLSDGFKLYGRRQHPGELAVVDLKIALTEVKDNYDREDLEDYSGSGDDAVLLTKYCAQLPDS